MICALCYAIKHVLARRGKTKQETTWSSRGSTLCFTLSLSLSFSLALPSESIYAYSLYEISSRTFVESLDNIVANLATFCFLPPNIWYISSNTAGVMNAQHHSWTRAKSAFTYNANQPKITTTSLLN